MSEGMHVTARSTYDMTRKEACLDISDLAKVTFTTCHTLKFTHATIDLEKGHLLQTVTIFGKLTVVPSLLLAFVRWETTHSANLLTLPTCHFT